MAMRKTGSRTITVDGLKYRWRIRHRGTNLQLDYGSGTLHVAVELSDKPGSSVLVIDTSRPHPKDACRRAPVVPVTPRDVAEWIKQALKHGWDPAGGKMTTMTASP